MVQDARTTALFRFMASQAGNRHPDRERWPWRSSAVSGSCWSLLRIGLYLPGAFACLSPRFYPHWFGPAGPLLDGVPRFGGALLSLRRSRWTKTRNAVCPMRRLCFHFDASQCPLSSHHAIDSPSSTFRLPLNACVMLPQHIPYAAATAFETQKISLGEYFFYLEMSHLYPI